MRPHRWSSQWARVRRLVLERDGYRCRIVGPRCLGHATTVDHIKPRSVRPDLLLEPSNLRAACRPCQQENMPTARVLETGRRPGW